MNNFVKKMIDDPITYVIGLIVAMAISVCWATGVFN
jgi:hypothetical protein